MVPRRSNRMRRHTAKQQPTATGRVIKKQANSSVSNADPQTPTTSTTAPTPETHVPASAVLDRPQSTSSSRAVTPSNRSSRSDSESPLLAARTRAQVHKLFKTQAYSSVSKADAQTSLPTSSASTASPTPETDVSARAGSSRPHFGCSPRANAPSSRSTRSDSKSSLLAARTRLQARAAKNPAREPPLAERKKAEREQIAQKRLQPWIMPGRYKLKLEALIYDDAVEQLENFWEDFGELIGGVGTEGDDGVRRICWLS